MNRFKDKTFIGFYLKFPHYFCSILTINKNLEFNFISHKKQLSLTEYLSKSYKLYGAIPVAEVDFFKHQSNHNTAALFYKNDKQALSAFYLGYEQGHKIFLMAKVSDSYLQERSIRYGKSLSIRCHHEVDILALWHLVYWQSLKHDYLSLTIVWIFALDAGYYLLLGRGENLWAYSFVTSFCKIKDWLLAIDFPYPAFYGFLNQSQHLSIPHTRPLYITNFHEWTLSAALALRGAYASI